MYHIYVMVTNEDDEAGLQDIIPLFDQKDESESQASTPRFKGDWEQNLLLWCDQEYDLLCIRCTGDTERKRHYYMCIGDTRCYIHIMHDDSEYFVLHVYYYNHLYPMSSFTEVVDCDCMLYLIDAIRTFKRIVMQQNTYICV